MVRNACETSRPKLGLAQIPRRRWRPARDVSTMLGGLGDLDAVSGTDHDKESSMRVSTVVNDAQLHNRKRLPRRDARIQALCRRRPGLISDHPTDILLLVNVGATGDVGGVLSADVHALLEHLDGFVRLEMGLGKPWSFVVCKSLHDAKAIRSLIDNTTIPTSGGGSKTIWVEYAAQLSSDIVVTDPTVIRNKVPGLRVVLDAISPDQEAFLLNEMQLSAHEDSAAKRHNDMLDETQSSQWIRLLKRNVRHYGFHFDYPTMTTTRSCKLPRYVRSVVEHISTLDVFTKEELDPTTETGSDNNCFFHLDQLTINEYWPGAGIGVHTDRHSQFKGPIVALSLQAGVVMEFTPYRANRKEITAARLAKCSASSITNKTKSSDILAGDTASIKSGFSNVFDDLHDDDLDDVVQVYLPPRSLAIMSGPSRYGWTHAIRARKTDIVNGRACARENRISFTFRYVRRKEDGPCTCGYECCN